MTEQQQEQPVDQPVDQPLPTPITPAKNTNKFAKGNPGKPKGALNKKGKSAMEAIAMAAETLGGADRLAAWAGESKKNEEVFWSKIYIKLLPLQLTGAGGGNIQVTLSQTDANL